MGTLSRLLEFVRVTDEKGRLSITNLTALVALAAVLLPQVSEWYRAVVVPALGGDYTQLGLFGFALLNYLGKRFVEANKERVPQIQALERQIADLAAQLQASNAAAVNSGVGERLREGY